MTVVSASWEDTEYIDPLAGLVSSPVKRTATEIAERLIKSYDADSDGKLSQSEFAQLARRFDFSSFQSPGSLESLATVYVDAVYSAATGVMELPDRLLSVAAPAQDNSAGMATLQSKEAARAAQAKAAAVQAKAAAVQNPSITSAGEQKPQGAGTPVLQAAGTVTVIVLAVQLGRWLRGNP